MWSSSSSSLLSSATTTTTTRTKSKTTSVLVPQKRGRRRRRPFVHIVENKNRIAFTKLELSENESSTVVVRLRQSDERFEHLRQVLKKTNKGDEFKATILNENCQSCKRMALYGARRIGCGEWVELAFCSAAERRIKGTGRGR